MSIIKPFRAVRPTRDKAQLVATRPLADYKKNLLEAKMESNPYTFLHIIHPDFEDGEEKDLDKRYHAVRKRFDDFCTVGILEQDITKNLYLYRQTHDHHVFLGVIGGASIDEYNKGLIKKHEATLTSREEMFTHYLDVVGFNAEPVLLFHTGNKKLEGIYQRLAQQRPEYEFSTTDRIKHELWLVEDNDILEIQACFAEMQALYIADGHHRSASSARLCQICNDQYDNKNYFLAFFIEETQLRILEFNRLVKKLNMPSEEYLDKVRANYHVEKLSQKRYPSHPHEIIMNLQNDWYALECNASIIDENSPVRSLDTEILTRTILDPILGIKDLKTDENIRFVSGDKGIEAIESMIQAQKADLGFVLHPLTAEQIKRVADHELIMPPKSTWVEPKLRSG